MSKYEVDDDHWEPDEDDEPPAWAERTSAKIDLEVTLTNEGYQTDRRWTVRVLQGHRDHPVAIYAAEHHNKGNYWRESELWNDAVDFLDLPPAVQQRVADMLNRSVEAVTPEERAIHRDDGLGMRDDYDCDVCGGTVYGHDGDGPARHADCVPEGGEDSE